MPLDNQTGDDTADAPSLAISPADRDIAIRTMIGEEGTPQGQAGVASTMLNRATSGNYGGKTLAGVAFAPSQFESWTSNAHNLLAISPDDPAYQRAASIFDGVASGQIPDYTGGATNFYAPKLQAQLGRAAPSWANGQGTQLGSSLFYAPNGPVSYQAPAASQNASALSFTSLPGAGFSMADDAIEALINGKAAPQAKSAAPPQPGVTFNEPPAPASGSGLPSWVIPQRLQGAQALPSPVTDTDIDALMAAPKTGGPASASTAAPIQSSDGVRLPTGELVVGGKPFTSDNDLWSGVQNFANGALLGAGVPLSAAVQAAKAKYIDGSGLSFGNLYDQAKSAYSGGRADYQAQNPVTAAVTEGAGMLAPAVGIGNLLAGATSAVPVVGNLLSGGAGVAAADGTGGNLFTRMASQGAAGALQGGAVGAAASGLNDRPTVDNLLSGAGGGAVVGAALPMLASGTRGLTNAALGTSTNPARAALADTALNRFNIPIGGGQISSSPAVRVLDSVVNRIPGAGGAASRDAQQTAFNRAVASTIGETADQVTPDVMAAARDRIGGVFDSVAARTPLIQADRPFAQDLHDVATDAHLALTPEELAPIRNQIGNIIDKIDPTTGGITGDTYQALTRRGAPLDRAQQSGNSNIAHYAGQIRDALDDAMERSASPEVVADLRQARTQYRNMRTIDPLIAKDGTGDVSSRLLHSAVVTKNKGTYGAAYGGGGDLGTLGQIGKTFLSDPPNSNTADRSLMMQLLGGIGTGGVGLLAGEVPLSAALTGAGATIGSSIAARTAGNVLRSAPYANMLVRRGLANATPQEPTMAQNLLSGVGSQLPIFSGLAASQMRPAVANSSP